jgi:N-acetylmuramoyl-L-alanine amidase
MGETPRIKRIGKADDEDIAEMIRELRMIVVEANAAEQRASERLQQILQQDRVEQGEIAATVESLRRWAQSVQKTGLPVDEDMRTAILSLTQPTESVEGMYNYLHLALPLLPGLLSVESEIDLNRLWAEIKERWRTSTKGDNKVTADETIYGTGASWAVLVGVNEYEDKANYGQLQVCVKDVEAIYDQLVGGGFEAARIRLLTDDKGDPPSRANVLSALKAVADATEPDDLLLFYYSGHGEEVGGESYLIARDGRRLVLDDTAVSLSRVKEIVEEAPARAKVIVLDACHSGADIGGKGPEPMSEAFIRRVFEQAEGMAVLASCKQGQLSYEWRDNDRSVFTHFLLEALTGDADRDQKGFVTVQDVSHHVTNGVKLWASQRNTSQTPTLQYTVAGDIILVRYG